MSTPLWSPMPRATSDFGGHEIHAGEYLALLDGALLGSYSSEKTLFKGLSWAFDELSPEFITVYYGSDVAEDKGERSRGDDNRLLPGR